MSMSRLASSLLSSSFPASPPFLPFQFQSNHTNPNPTSNRPMAAHHTSSEPQFEDMFPAMADRLCGEALIGEICKGFRLLVDGERGVITLDSLKRNTSVLGLDGMSDSDLRSVIDSGDFDGDGALSEMEFCVLMVRMSPQLMQRSQGLLDEAFEGESVWEGDGEIPFYQFL